MQHPIIILNFPQNCPLNLQLDHYYKNFDQSPFEWYDGPNKMAWQVVDGSVGMIVNADGEGFGIYFTVMRLKADVGYLMWR